jgi:beta-lactamase regulating signal transducer with metallopeptidase domain
MTLLAILVDAAVKGAVILTLATALAAVLRRSSAAARHLVWSAALAVLVALPVLSAALPSWQVPILPSPATGRQAAAPSPAADVTGTAAIAFARAAGQQPDPSAEAAQAQSVLWQACLATLWAAGALAVFAPYLLGARAARRLEQSAHPAGNSSWRTTLDRAAADLGLSRRVRLLVSPQAGMPMAWGALRPVIFLPVDADTWPADKRRAVLLHELAHVKRLDCLTQLAARAACAMYWFNPLVHLVAAKMRDEREQACDDLVLAAGQKASGYAAQLLSISQQMRPAPFTTAAAVAMARPSRVEGRLVAILDATRSRRAVTRAVALATVLIAAVVAIPVACVRVAAVEDQKSVVESKASAPVLATLPAGEKMVLIEARFIEVLTKDRQSVDRFFAKSGIVRPKDAQHAILVTEAQAAALLKEIQSLPGAGLISAPTILAYEGREARVSVGSPIPVTLPLVEDRARLATATLDSGVFLVVCPEAAKEPRSTNLKIASSVVELLANRKNVTRESRNEANLTVPEGKWVLLHTPAKTYFLTGIIGTKIDPQTSRPETEFERQAIDEVAKDGKDIYILVKPQPVTDAGVERPRG